MCKAWLAEGDEITTNGKEAETMDGYEVYKRHELNPWWWLIVPCGSLGALAVVHFLARW